MNSRISRGVVTVAVVFLSIFGFTRILRATDITAYVEGLVTKVDRSAKIVVVKATDGTEHTMHLVGRTVVYGGHEIFTGADEAARGLQEGSRVVAHYTKQGGDETAEEIDRIGAHGLKSSEGAISRFDRTAQIITIKIADGTEETYRLTVHAAEDAGRNTDDAAKTLARATVYYSEETGQKVAHFFRTT
jgi:hypothetical protein